MDQLTYMGFECLTRFSNKVSWNDAYNFASLGLRVMAITN